MYSLPYFTETRREVLLDFMQQHPFALLTGSFSSGLPVATQVPILMEERDGKLFLQAHIMRQTDHHLAFLENPNALVVFNGPHSYVSATWYSGVHIASTWNYMSVHARGTLRFLDDAALTQLLRKLSLHFENGNTDSPTVYDRLPPDFIQHMQPAIVAFEIEVNDLSGVFKLSQNRDEESYKQIISRLQQQGGEAALVAAEMQKRTNELFPSEKKNEK